MAADLHPGHLAAGGQSARWRRHEMARPLHRAHPRHPRAPVEQPPRPQRLGEESDVEAGVVGHHRPPGQVGHQQVGDLIEAGRPDELLGDKTVDVSGAHVHAHAGVDERGPTALDVPGGVGEHERDLQDRVRRGGQAGGLQVDDGVADPGCLGQLCGCGSGGRLAGGRGGVGAQRAAVGGWAVVEGHRPDPLASRQVSPTHGAPGRGRSAPGRLWADPGGSGRLVLAAVPYGSQTEVGAGCVRRKVRSRGLSAGRVERRSR